MRVNTSETAIEFCGMSPGQPEALTERCELQAGSTVRGDIESPRLTVDENATFVAAQRSGRRSHSGLTFVCRAKRDRQRNRLRKVYSRSHNTVIRVYDEAGKR